MLNLGDARDKKLDFRAQKLTVAKLVKLLIEAQLRQHSSYSVIVENLRASKRYQNYLDLDSTSRSQISRKLRALPYTYSQALFLNVVRKLQQLTRGHKGIPGIGRLNIVDSTEISLPTVAGQWAHCSSSKNAVKMHTRLIVADKDTVFPDRIIASTADVADNEVVLNMVAADDAIYVMDRGYIVYKNYKTWSENHIRFVARIKAQSRTEVIRERPVPESTDSTITITRDADVKVSFRENGETKDVELRLVEFRAKQGNQEILYRLVTTVHDLAAEQICEIYRHRWMIELFFKWVKQHLKLVKLYSVDSNAVWSQMYLALTAYALVQIVRLETGAKQSAWQVLQLLQIYIYRSWNTFLKALFRPPTRTSKGRQKKAKRGRPRKHPVKLKRARLIVQ